MSPRGPLDQHGDTESPRGPLDQHEGAMSAHRSAVQKDAEGVQLAGPSMSMEIQSPLVGPSISMEIQSPLVGPSPAWRYRVPSWAHRQHGDIESPRWPIDQHGDIESAHRSAVLKSNSRPPRSAQRHAVPSRALRPLNQHEGSMSPPQRYAATHSVRDAKHRLSSATRCGLCGAERHGCLSGEAAAGLSISMKAPCPLAGPSISMEI